MTGKEIHLEYLLSKIVVDSTGVRVGRIEELHGEQSGADFEILEVMLGPHALFERLTTWLPKIGITPRRLGFSYRIPWQNIDISDPNRPRLLVPKSSLKPEE